MVGFLKSGGHLLPVKGFRQIIGSGQEAQEQIHHITIGGGADEILGIFAGSHFETEVRTGIELGTKTGFQGHLGEAGIIMGPQSRFQNPLIKDQVVFAKNSQLGGTLLLTDDFAN